MSPIILSSDTASVDLALDPSEVAVDRTELAINVSPIRVAEAGIDWGDAQIEAYMAEAHRGQVPVDFRVPNRTITIPIIYGPAEDAALTAARAALRAKVARIQQEGGWLKRSEGRYCDVVNATLREPDRHSYLGYEIDVVLTLEAIPDFYGDEIELDDIEETTAAEIVQVLQLDAADAVIDGDYPGRVRIVVDEDDGETQHSLMWGLRSRYYSSAATAALVYDAEDLTPVGQAAVSGGSVEHTNLQTVWTSVLSTEHAVSGHLTHQGTYRVWARAQSDSDVPPQLRILYGVGGLSVSTDNTGGAIARGDSEWHLVNLGTIFLRPSLLGTHYWEGLIQAKANAAGDDVTIGKLWLQPIDDGAGHLTAIEPTLDDLSPVGSDDFTGTTSGNALNGRTATFGGTWATSGATTDFAFADDLSGEQVKRSTTADASGRLALLGSTSYGDLQIASVIQASAYPTGVSGNNFQGVARGADSSNHVRGYLQRGRVSSQNFAQLALVSVVAGTPAVLGTTAVDIADAPVSTDLLLRLTVFETGRAVLELYDETGEDLIADLDVSSATLATGGSLASGKPGLWDMNDGANAANRWYDNVEVTVPVAADAVIFPNGYLEIRTDGIYRLGADGTGSSPIIGVGDMPRIPPSGIEERPVELFIKWSRSDLGDIPDAGVDDASARVTYRASWLFPS